MWNNIWNVYGISYVQNWKTKVPCEDGQIRVAYHAQKIEEECPQAWWKKITASMVCDVLIFETLE